MQKITDSLLFTQDSKAGSGPLCKNLAPTGSLSDTYLPVNILLETPFDVIKLDKKFMENMMVSGKGKLILEQVVLMAEKLVS